jgi:hypothetical protein
MEPMIAAALLSRLSVGPASANSLNPTGIEDGPIADLLKGLPSENRPTTRPAIQHNLLALAERYVMRW